MSRSSNPLVILAVTVGIVLSACSSSDRMAAPADEGVVSPQATEPAPESEPLGQTPDSFTPDTKTCPEKRSWTYRARLWNYLPYPIVIRAGDYICNDWSGVSTPGNVFNGTVIGSMQSFDVRLEAADNVSRSWTMQFAAADSGQVLGTVRMRLGRGSDFAVPIPSKSRLVDCRYAKLDAENPYDTGDYFWPTKEPDDMALLVYEERITLVTACYTPRPE